MKEERVDLVHFDPTSPPERPAALSFWTGRSSKPNVERGIKTTFTGLLFLTMALITLFVLPGSGTAWWFWMLILAAFFGLSGGVTEIVRHVVGSRQHAQIGRSVSTQPTPTPTRVERELPAAETGEIVTPPSVTEATTKQLNKMHK